MTDSNDQPIRVLFLCTHNSSRSQMAGAFLRRYEGDRFDVHSAGTDPTRRINPLAEVAMGLLDMSLIGQYPKHLDQYIDQSWAYIITTCDDANEAWPVFPDDPTRIHWGFQVLPRPGRRKTACACSGASGTKSNGGSNPLSPFRPISVGRVVASGAARE
jgi:arsenate reductase